MSVAVAAIHQAKGFFAQVSTFDETKCCHRKLYFKVYVDDFGGVESTEEKAKASFQEMGKLLKELGFEESWEKAEGENEPDECNNNCLSCVTTRSSARDDLPGDYLQHKGGDHEGRNLSVLSK